MPQELKPSPRVAGLSALADALMRAKATANRYEVKQWMPLLGGTGVGDLVLGRGPEEINEWSYGNSPLTVPQLSNVPQFKKGRAEQLVDVTNLAPIVGGLGALARRPVMAAGRAGERLAERVIPRVMERGGIPAQLLQDLAQGSQSAVIKQKGGNWLSGSIEDALKGLKRGDYENEAVRNLRRVRPNMTVEEAREFIQAAPVDPRDAAMNAWIDKQLRNYVRNDMATEGDPIRALAERGILHREINPNMPTRPTLGNRVNREHAGFDPEGVAQSDLAKYWENISDNVLRSENAGDLMADRMLSTGENPHLKQNPWLATVPPETKVSRVDRGYDVTQDLGFNHLIDELRNATNPNSGLPRELLLKYDSLNNVSVPQAVERVASINAWRAAQKAEADLAKANNAATVLHKDYPGKGFKWVELKSPAAARENLSPSELKTYETYIADKYPEDHALKEATERSRKASLQDALKYEGDTMGHCVGGYCDEVASGRTKIYSLRDAKGQPHTTIEVQPGIAPPRDAVRWSDLPEELQESMASRGLAPSEHELINTYFDPVKGTRYLQYDPRIVQIKGKANKAPNPEYLPYVQDFVKSGQWSDVGDLGNTGLKSRSIMFDKSALEKPEISALPEYFTQDELEAAQKAYAAKLRGEAGYASGGLVSNTYNPARVDEIVSGLRQEFAF